MLAMSRTGDRNVVARKRSNMVCNSTSPRAAAMVQRCERADHFQSTMPSYSHTVSFVHQQKGGLEFGGKGYRFPLACVQMCQSRIDG